MAGSDTPAGMAQTMLNTVVLVFSLLAGLVVFLRLFSRGMILHKAGAEDIWISLAMVLSIGLTVTIALQVKNGLGMHIQELTPAMMVDSLKAFWASIWIYYLALTATKISILTQYLRVFPLPRFRIACFIVIGIVALYGFWTFIGSIFLCFPVAFFWDRSIAGGVCLNQKAIWFSNAAVNIAQDVLILFLPMTVLRSLDMPSKQKRALIVVFGIGGVVCVVSIIRLQTLISISNSTDPTFDNGPAAILSAIEVNVGIVCACLPSMRPLLSSMMPTMFSDGSQYTNSWKYNGGQPKHMRYGSTSSRSYTPDSYRQSGHSRSGSAASQSYTPRSQSRAGVTNPSRPGSVSNTRSGSADHSRTGSTGHPRSGSKGPVYIPTAPSRSYSRASDHQRTLRNNSRVSAHSDTELNYLPSYYTTTPQLSSRDFTSPALQRSLSNGQQRPAHPLFSPIPTLPRLPEHMALFSPMDSLVAVPGQRIPLFHKPLPITPLPGSHTAPQYLTTSQDQATLPIMLSPGLVSPQTLNSDPRPAYQA